MKPGKLFAELKTLLASAPRRTLAVAESMTCGNLQTRIGGVSGASGFFLGGLTAYSLEGKVLQLGVNRAAAEKVNCVSGRVAREMAEGACRLFRSDLAVATTGYAEPAPALGATAPFAWWALAERRGGKFLRGRLGRVECPGADRGEAQAIVADAVLTELVAYLREQHTRGVD